MSLREQIAEALAVLTHDETDPEVGRMFLPEADAALAVMARRVELALGRINEVRVRLRMSLADTDSALRTNTETIEMRTSLLDAMTQLQGMLPAESAAKWAEKMKRQP